MSQLNGIDEVTFRAGTSTLRVSNSLRDACKITEWDWGNPDQNAQVVAGSDGGKRYAPSDWSPARNVSVTVESTNGQVAGDADGLAINRTWGRPPVETSGGGSGDLIAATWDADLEDLPGTLPAFDAACDVLASAPVTVRLRLVVGGTSVTSEPHAIPAGRWTPVVSMLPSGGMARTSYSVLRVVVVNAPPGLTIQSRMPSLGVGLHGKYHDEFTPGATLGDNGRAIRPANGVEWANAILSDLSRFAGSVAADTNATVTREGDALADSFTLAIHSAATPAAQDGPHRRGFATTKIDLSCAPLADGAERELTLSEEFLGSEFDPEVMTEWVADGPLPGDAPARLRIESGWQYREDMAAWVTDRSPVVEDAASSALHPTFAHLPANVDEATVVVADGQLDVSVAMGLLANYISPAGIVTVTLLVNGSPAAYRDVPQAVSPVTTPSSRWGEQVVRFGRFALAAGDVLSIRVEANGAAGRVRVSKWLLFGGAASSALLVARDPRARLAVVYADDFSTNEDAGSVDGRVASGGGTWSGDGDLEPGRLEPWSSGATLGDALPSPAVAGVAVAYIAGAGVKSPRLDMRSGGLLVSAAPDGDTIVTPGGLWRVPQSPYADPDDETERVMVATLIVTPSGRVSLYHGPSGMAPAFVGAVHDPAAAGVAWAGGVSSPAGVGGDARVVSVQVLSGDPEPDPVWSDQPNRVVLGDYPTLPAGSTPHVVVRGNATTMDTSAAQSAITVQAWATPRYTQVPG